jgi:hypothetical protein
MMTLFRYREHDAIRNIGDTYSFSSGYRKPNLLEGFHKPNETGGIERILSLGKH